MDRTCSAPGRSRLAGERLLHQADLHHPMVLDPWFVRSHRQAVSFSQAIRTALKQEAVTAGMGGAEHQRVPHPSAQIRPRQRYALGRIKAAVAEWRLL